MAWALFIMANIIFLLVSMFFILFVFCIFCSWLIFLTEILLFYVSLHPKKKCDNTMNIFFIGYSSSVDNHVSRLSGILLL